MNELNARGQTCSSCSAQQVKPCCILFSDGWTGAMRRHMRPTCADDIERQRVLPTRIESRPLPRDASSTTKETRMRCALSKRRLIATFGGTRQRENLHSSGCAFPFCCCNVPWRSWRWFVSRSLRFLLNLSFAGRGGHQHRDQGIPDSVLGKRPRFR
jgi:hypothetical protein